MEVSEEVLFLRFSKSSAQGGVIGKGVELGTERLGVLIHHELQTLSGWLWATLLQSWPSLSALWVEK